MVFAFLIYKYHGVGIMKSRIYFILCILFLATIKTIAQVIYVDSDATGANNGTSWVDAFIYLQDALDIAASADDIWVAEGIYYPDEDKDADHINNDNTETFQMIDGVDMLGGFDPEIGEDELFERDPDNNETILNGDQDQSGTKNSNDAANVVRGADNAILDGFTIKNGYANTSSIFNGGGMYNSYASPTVINCKFISNKSYYGGGGMFNDYSNPTVSLCEFLENSTIYIGSGAGLLLSNASSTVNINHCTFVDNQATAHGGGISIEWGTTADITISNCTFKGNSAPSYGGGLWNYGANSKIIKCTFDDNNSETGGAVDTRGGNPEFKNCVFINNEASTWGGALNAYISNPSIVHCSFSQNSAGSGNDGLGSYDCSPEITNSIFWGSDDQIGHGGNGTLTVTYSDIQQASGIFSGIGNINDDPSFVNSTDLHLTSSSYCLGAGADLGVLEDRDGNLRPRPVGTNPDMGAYEYAPIILPDLTVFLEGPYSGGQLTTTLNSNLPLSQPFNLAPWNYGGKESISSIPENITDWILLELRSDSQSSSMIVRKAAFLKNDGSVVETDGSSSISFDDVASGDYFVVVYHRNHLPIMSSAKILVE